MSETVRHPRLAFDADVLIYAAVPGHALGRRVHQLLAEAPRDQHCASVLLLPELMSKPLREGRTAELVALRLLLSRLQLVDTSEDIAALAAQLGAAYRLRAADAVHLASAVAGGAEAFVTNNRKDFGAQNILEIPVLFPEMLPAW
ncbi:type II toxin-antitoxin system VapC family toxin [Deinococcus peraridilitoris]|uniref:type II toxin-antitoxin system VapC family toxin n=1 Tax=Deinococcus peraridilitoris TaxID=432329 RepID=UPI000301B542|nr:PIN domain-containing protein [Deinococcus peraridilitoris]